MRADTLLDPGRVLIPIMLAAVAEIAAWTVALLPGTLEGPWYGRPTLLVAVHLLALGVGAAALTGAGWQLVPVLTARPGSTRLAPWVDALLLLGLPLALAGFLAPGAAGTVGAAIVVLALVLRGALVVPQLLGGARPAARAWLLLAEGALLVGLGVGALLWVGRLGHPVLADPIAGVALHARLLIGGWIGGWIAGIGSLLLPMFAVGPEPRPRRLGLVAAAWFTGVMLGNPWVLAAAALSLAALLGRSLQRGLRGGPALAQVGFGLAGLALGAVLLPWAPGDVTVAALLVLFVLPVVRGVAQRIVPFLAWTHVFGSKPRGAPPVADLVPDGLARAQLAASAVGAALVVLDRAFHLGIGVVGASLALVGALTHLAVLAIGPARVAKARKRRAVLPGMEAR